MLAIGNSTKSITLASSSQDRGFESNNHRICSERERKWQKFIDPTKMLAIGNIAQSITLASSSQDQWFESDHH